MATRKANRRRRSVHKKRKQRGGGGYGVPSRPPMYGQQTPAYPLSQSQYGQYGYQQPPVYRLPVYPQSQQQQQQQQQQQPPQPPVAYPPYRRCHSSNRCNSRSLPLTASHRFRQRVALPVCHVKQDGLARIIVQMTAANVSIKYVLENKII